MNIDYKWTVEHEDMHNKFNAECVNINNFKLNSLMKIIVQNCPYDDGMKHLEFITQNYKQYFDLIDFDLLKYYDTFGSQGDHSLILGVSPKVISYIKESLIFLVEYVIPRKISEIYNLMVIGGGYGMEVVILKHIADKLNINIKNIISIDMENVVKLQNMFFEHCSQQEKNINQICKAYTPDYNVDNIDMIYSNCCLSELSPIVNYDYFNRYVDKSKYFFIVWTRVFADIPEYYNKNISERYILLGNNTLLTNL